MDAHFTDLALSVSVLALSVSSLALSVSSLALSVTACAVPPLPKGEALAKPHTLHLSWKHCVDCQGLSLWESC